MGSRGTFASGNKVVFAYETVGFVEGVKVLQKLEGSQKLPEEAHSSSAYIKLDKNGVFSQYREYDSDRYLVLEIGYHPEPGIDKSGVRVLHAHEYDRSFSNRRTRPLTVAEFEKYKKYFKGVV